MSTVAFILCGKVIILLHFGSFLIHKCIPLSSLSDIDILRDTVADLKVSTISIILLHNCFVKIPAGKILAVNFLMQRYDAMCEKTEKTFSFSRLANIMHW